MRTFLARAYRSLPALATSPHSRQLVFAAAVVMILAQLGFRAWALYPSWFYSDDYLLLLRAKDGLDLQYLLEPHNGHLMPAGRFVVWAVLSSGGLSWGMAATTSLVLQALASMAALWMLVVLFRARWAVLFPLGVYLFSTLTLPALMWWAAALNQLAMQSGFFVAVGAWVLYLRGRGFRWVGVTTVAIGFGLAFDVKALLILPVLAFLMLAYFCEGSLRDRVRSATRRFWQSALVLGLATAVYLGYYLTQVDAPFTTVGPGEAMRTAAKMLGTAFTTAAVGGPWNWSPGSSPNAGAAPPTTAVHLAWVAISMVVLYAALQRRRSLRAWGLLLGYLIALLALLVTSRVAAYGVDLGLQYRFLSDAACVLALSVALAHLPLVGARESSETRPEPLLRVRVPDPAVAVLLVVLVGSGVFSSVRYVRYWHQQNPSMAYAENLRAGLADQGRVDVADQGVPQKIVDPLAAPYNDVSRVISLWPNQARFPPSTSDLWVVDTQGQLQRALVKAAVVSRPGPQRDCGWRVGQSGRSIPLAARAIDYSWWLRLGYLASTDSPVTVSAGSEQVQARLRKGLHSLFVKVTGSFDSVEISGLAPGTALCVDTVEVGEAVSQEDQ